MTDLQVSQEGAVATITLSRPFKGNSISTEMAGNLLANVLRMENDPTVRVIILTGRGETFCTGMDLHITPEQATRENLYNRAAGGVEMYEARGIVPAIISCYIVREIGPLRAKDLMLTARKISADEAYNMGMLTAVVDTVEELDLKTKEFADHLLAGATGAQGASKALINLILSPISHHQALDRAKAAFADAVSGPEAKYGIEAFKNKKQPDWTALSAKL